MSPSAVASGAPAYILTSYALVDGKRSVYIPVTKRADASTLDVVQNVQEALPRMRAAIPEDIDVNFAFDQSGYVTNAIRALVTAGKASSVSAFVQHAIRVSLHDVAGWREMLEAALEESGGALTARERAWADARLRPRRRTHRARRGTTA